MQYVLDERLLPPGGAPVQCTRCSHVFTAVPGGAGRSGAPTPVATPRAPSSGAPVRSSTQVFGGRPEAPAGEREQSPARSTQVFGALPPRASTQVFGAPVAGEAPPRASTQVFGTPAAGAPPRASTQVFGGAPGQEAPPPPRASTQVFGTPVSSAAPGAPAPGGEPSWRTSTQVFGAGAPAPEPAPPQRPSTQVFGAPLPPERAAAPAPGRASTQVFGTPAVPDTPRASTQVFGAPGPGALPGDEPAARSPRSPRVDLPPELISERAARAQEPRARAPAPPRSRTALWLMLLAALLAALAFFAWRTVQRRSSAFPPQAVAARDAAAALLRRDDARSRQAAITSLEEVVRAHPAFVEAQAELVSALALEFDDAKVLRAQARTRELAVQRERAELEAARAPEGWERQVEQLRRVEAGHREAGQAQLRRADAASARAEEVLRQLEQAPPKEAPAAVQVSRARAQALLAAVHGGPVTPSLTQRLRAAGDSQGWDVIAEAEYALNASDKALQPEARREAASALEALRQRDAAFLRAYVLGARLALASGNPRAAGALLDMALSLNPAHEVAQALQAVSRAGNSMATPAP